jgi:hypothetical protein
MSVPLPNTIHQVLLTTQEALDHLPKRRRGLPSARLPTSFSLQTSTREFGNIHRTSSACYELSAQQQEGFNNAGHPAETYCYRRNQNSVCILRFSKLPAQSSHTISVPQQLDHHQTAGLQDCFLQQQAYQQPACLTSTLPSEGVALAWETLKSTVLYSQMRRDPADPRSTYYKNLQNRMGLQPCTLRNRGTL